MAMFSPALEVVLKNEGGLTKANPNDPGGITNYGISLRFLKSVVDPSLYGIYDHEIDADTIRNLSITQAGALYQGEFWNVALFKEIQDQDVCNCLFDMGINFGIAPAVKCCQRAIWSVWKHYNTPIDDGILGHETLMWIERCKPSLLIAAMRSERAGEFRLIAERKTEEAPNIPEWLTRAYQT